jgi:hypothetical protein
MIDLTKASTVHIGRRGEHHFRNIEFDVSSLLNDDYPSAALQAIYKRPDGTAYPVVTSYANEVLTWSPSATDTIDVGVGQLEIRVVYGDVVGKSVRVITIVEEALVDGIVEPPEPPAQEWLNQVLAALAALDVNDVYSLLTLTYNLVNDNYALLNTTHDRLNDTYGLLTTTHGLVDDNYTLLNTTHILLEDNYTLLNTTHGLLNDNYNLLNTTHDLIEDMQDTLSMRTGILLNHWHPIETASAPDMTSRRASITFTNVGNGNNVVIGTVTYTFVTALGNPAANSVHVLIQGTLRGTVQKLAQATRGIQDESNIAFGTGTNPNFTCTAYWTSQRFSVGDAAVASGESLFVLERAENISTALTLTSTATATINGFARTSYLRYVMSGNVLSGGGSNSIRGPLHTVLPINSVVIGGQGGPLHPETTYDCHLLTLCRQSDTSEKELDLYISSDEETFTRISRSTPVGFSSTGDATHVHIELRQSRIPTGYGLYICMGSNGTSSSAYCDLKFTYHLYPVALATDTLFE